MNQITNDIICIRLFRRWMGIMFNLCKITMALCGDNAIWLCPELPTCMREGDRYYVLIRYIFMRMKMFLRMRLADVNQNELHHE